MNIHHDPAIAQEPERGKSWQTSRTLWLNGLALLAFVLQSYFGRVVLDVELQGAILTALNLVLRFDTSEPLK